VNKYLKAVSFNFLYLITSTIAFLILTPVAIRVMGEEFYGLYVILSSIMLFSNIGNLGIGTIVNKFYSPRPLKEPVRKEFLPPIYNRNFLLPGQAENSIDTSPDADL
jgi:O-antigen/teichoic acid export membrane protein